MSATLTPHKWVPRSLTEHFSSLTDPRVERTRLHPLQSILVIALCAVICGAEDWDSVTQYGRLKQAWFEEWLDLPHGIPSHDTFGRVFCRAGPDGVRALLYGVGGQHCETYTRRRCRRGWQDLPAVFRPRNGKNAVASGERLCGSRGAGPWATRHGREI